MYEVTSVLQQTAGKQNNCEKKKDNVKVQNNKMGATKRKKERKKERKRKRKKEKEDKDSKDKGHSLFSFNFIQSDFNIQIYDKV